MTALLGSVGSAGISDVDGANMPAISSLDTVGLLGALTPSLVSALNRFSQSTGHPGSVAVISSAVDANGVLNVLEKVEEILSSGGIETGLTIADAKTYLQYQPDPTYSGQSTASPWKRYSPWSAVPSTGNDTLQSYEPYSTTSEWQSQNDSNAAVMGLLRQAISDFQGCVDASASAIYTNSANATAACPVSDLQEFLSKLRALCSDLDVLEENPPEISLKAALDYAVGKSSEFVGKAAAEISSEIGKQVGNVGGNFLSGFLENAGLLSVIVVGLIVHLYLR